jgi:predicted O-methyltransferase YrrM
VNGTLIDVAISYSTIWLAKALPEDGRLVTLELEAHHAKVCPYHILVFHASRCFKIAEENLANAGLSDKVKIIVGPAAETIAKLEPDPPFDFVFIDADKPSNLSSSFFF